MKYFILYNVEYYHCEFVIINDRISLSFNSHILQYKKSTSFSPIHTKRKKKKMSNNAFSFTK